MFQCGGTSRDEAYMSYSHIPDVDAQRLSYKYCIFGLQLELSIAVCSMSVQSHVAVF